MTNNHRELTGREKQRIKKLITSRCANHDKEYGCLPLDCDCPMFGIRYTNSALCSYFRKFVLPEDAELEAVFIRTPTTNCKQCGKPFPVDGKRVYCSERCAEEARRQQTAARVRKYREKKHSCVTVLPSKSLVQQGIFEGISASVRYLYLLPTFNRKNGYTISELKLLYENFMNFSTRR